MKKSFAPWRRMRYIRKERTIMMPIQYSSTKIIYAFVLQTGSKIFIKINFIKLWIKYALIAIMSTKILIAHVNVAARVEKNKFPKILYTIKSPVMGFCCVRMCWESRLISSVQSSCRTRYPSCDRLRLFDSKREARRCFACLPMRLNYGQGAGNRTQTSHFRSVYTTTILHPDFSL